MAQGWSSSNVDDTVYTNAAGTLGKGIAILGNDGTNPRAVSTNVSGHVNIADGGNSITVDGTFWQATQPASVASLPLPSGASTSAKQPALGTAGTASSDVITVQGIASMTALKVDGSAVTQPISAAALPLPSGAATAAKQPALGTAGTASADVITIQGKTSMTPVVVDGSGVTQPISGTITANAGTGTFKVGGDVASSSSDGGNPVKIGGHARTTELTAVSTDQRVDAVFDAVGKQIVLPYANPENFISGATASAITTTGATSLIAAQSAGVRSYVNAVVVSNSHATVGTEVQILDGTTMIWTGYAAPAGGGYTNSFPTPLRGSTATAVQAKCITSGANVFVSVAGYKGV